MLAQYFRYENSSEVANQSKIVRCDRQLIKLRYSFLMSPLPFNWKEKCHTQTCPASCLLPDVGTQLNAQRGIRAKQSCISQVPDPNSMFDCWCVLFPGQIAKYSKVESLSHKQFASLTKENEEFKSRKRRGLEYGNNEEIMNKTEI